MSSTDNKVESTDYPRMVGNKVFSTGNVVRWQRRLYIVIRHDQKNKDGERMLRLIPLDATNAAANPSESWPSLKEGYHSVELVARTVKAFILESISRSIWPGL